MAKDVAGEGEEAGHAEQEVLRGVERHLPPVLELQTKVLEDFTIKGLFLVESAK